MWKTLSWMVAGVAGAAIAIAALLTRTGTYQPPVIAGAMTELLGIPAIVALSAFLGAAICSLIDREPRRVGAWLANPGIYMALTGFVILTVLGRPVAGIGSMVVAGIPLAIIGQCGTVIGASIGRMIGRQLISNQPPSERRGFPVIQRPPSDQD